MVDADEALSIIETTLKAALPAIADQHVPALTDRHMAAEIMLALSSEGFAIVRLETIIKTELLEVPSAGDAGDSKGLLPRGGKWMLALLGLGGAAMRR